MKEAAHPLQSNTASPPRRPPWQANRINILPCAANSCKGSAQSKRKDAIPLTNILEAFAYGNLLTGPNSFPRDSAYGKAIKRLSDAEGQLLRLLNEEQKTAFDSFTQAQAEVSDRAETDRFLYGYRLGVLMTAETFTTADELVEGT
jgi:hypothetical protein